MQNPEIESLKEALAASPDNKQLRLILIRRMRLFAGYNAELEDLLKAALRDSPQQTELTGYLIDLYFSQGKFANCVLLAEDDNQRDWHNNSQTLIRFLLKAKLPTPSHQIPRWKNDRRRNCLLALLDE